MRVLVVASSHALPACELTDAVFHGLRAGTVLGRGLGMRTPGPGRNDGLNTPLRQLGTEGVNVIGFVRDKATKHRYIAAIFSE